MQDTFMITDYSVVFPLENFFEKLNKFLLVICVFLWVFISTCEGNWSMWPLIPRCWAQWAVQHMQLSYHIHQLINLLYDFVYNQLVVNLTDQVIIWLNSLQTHEIRLQYFYSASYCQDTNVCVNGHTSSPFPPSPFLLSLLLPSSPLFSLLSSLSLLFPFSLLSPPLFILSLFSSHRVEGDVGDPPTVEQPHASDHQVEGESSFNSCTRICTSSIASFPGHSCLQFLIACPMQKQPEGKGLG